jgi:hypothetical protein
MMTDKDAQRRPWCMFGTSTNKLRIPARLVYVDDGLINKYVSEHGGRWPHCRECTPEELAEHGLTQPPRIDSDAIELGVAFDSLAKDQAEWSQSTFGTDSERGPMGALKHLEKEAYECQIAETSSDLLEELADCFLLLIDASRRATVTPAQLVAAAQAKMVKNRARKWSKPVDGQPCEHVRDEEID